MCIYVYISSQYINKFILILNQSSSLESESSDEDEELAESDDDDDDSALPEPSGPLFSFCSADSSSSSSKVPSNSSSSSFFTAGCSVFCADDGEMAGGGEGGLEKIVSVFEFCGCVADTGRLRPGVRSIPG